MTPCDVFPVDNSTPSLVRRFSKSAAFVCNEVNESDAWVTSRREVFWISTPTFALPSLPENGVLFSSHFSHSQQVVLWNLSDQKYQ